MEGEATVKLEDVELFVVTRTSKPDGNWRG